MKKQILILVLGIALLSFTIVSSMYAGETKYFDLTNEIENLQSVSCEIQNNNSNLEGLNLITNSTGFMIATQLNYKPDSFTVVCLLNGEHYTSTISSGSSGGGGGGDYCITKWDCTEWSCDGNTGIATRNCIYPNNFCEPREDKPEEVSTCDIIVSGGGTSFIEDEEDIKDDTKGFFMPRWILFLIMGILLIIIIFLTIKLNKKTKVI